MDYKRTEEVFITVNRHESKMFNFMFLKNDIMILLVVLSITQYSKAVLNLQYRDNIKEITVMIIYSKIST